MNTLADPGFSTQSYTRINHTYLFVDIETTGLDPTVNGICAIGAYATGEDPDDLRGVFYEECDPRFTVLEGDKTVEVERSAMNVNGLKLDETTHIDAETLKHFDKFCKSLPGQLTLVFHNAKFDVAFLERYYRLNKMDTQLFRRVLCTVSLGFAVTGQAQSLKDLSQRYGITNGAAHNGLADAITTSKVFHAIRADLENGTPQTATPPAIVPETTWPDQNFWTKYKPSDWTIGDFPTYPPAVNPLTPRNGTIWVGDLVKPSSSIGEADVVSLNSHVSVDGREVIEQIEELLGSFQRA